MKEGQVLRRALLRMFTLGPLMTFPRNPVGFQNPSQIFAGLVDLIGPNGEIKGPNFEINSRGAFFYSGTPAAGNLIISFCFGQGTDRFGNHVFNKVGVYGTTGTAVQVDDQGPGWYTGSLAAGWGLAESALNYDAPTNRLILSGASGVFRPFHNFVSQFLIAAGANSPLTTALLEVQGSAFVKSGLVANVTAIDPSTTATAETWHVMTPLAAGFAAGVPAPRYRLMPDNTVMLNGQVSLTAANAGGITFFTLPAGYAPASDQFFSVPWNGTFNSGFIVKAQAAGGILQQVPTGANGNVMDLSGVRFALN